MSGLSRVRGRVACLVGAAFLAALPVEVPPLAAPPAGIAPREVVVLRNISHPASRKITARYLELRGIPRENVFSLALGAGRTLSRRNYEKRVAAPFRRWLRAHPHITTAVTTSGFPYRIEGVEGRPESDAAIDNELALVLREDVRGPAGWVANPLFLKGANPFAVRNPRLLGMIYVARLDGPDPDLVIRRVEEAIAAEREGLQGRVATDTRGYREVTGYGLGDALLREAHDRLIGAGFEGVLDERPRTWRPEGEEAAIAENAAWYGGWYSLRNFQDVFGARGLARGAIAWHLASAEAVDLWSPDERGWAVNLIRRGAAATWGPVREPYLAAFPHADTLVDALLEGWTLAEAYWLSLPAAGWALVLLGDPLYRPFAKPRPAIAAECYRARGDHAALRARKPERLIVKFRCIGPEGARLPRWRGRLEGGRGLRSAAGGFELPSLGAGEEVSLEVGSAVCEGGTGDLFRLAIDLEGEAGRRRVVLEGRIDMARLTATGRDLALLEAAPSCRFALAGLSRFPVLVDTGSLRSRRLPGPVRRALEAARFGRSGGRLAAVERPLPAGPPRLALYDLESAARVEFPEGILFGGWFGEGILLRREEGARETFALWTPEAPQAPEPLPPPPAPLRFHSLAVSGTPLFQSEDGALYAPAAGGPGARGRVEFRRVLEGPGPYVEAEADAEGGRAAAIDREGVLWAAGKDGKRRRVADRVERPAAWAPGARRAAFRTAAGEAVIADFAADSLTPLEGGFTRGWWDAEGGRLLYVDKAPPAKRRVMLWRDGGAVPVAPIAHTGEPRAAAFPARGAAQAGDFGIGGDEVLILTNADIEHDVWVLALPPAPPPKPRSRGAR